MPKILRPHEPRVDIFEMVLAGGACAWTDAEMAGYKRYTEGWENKHFGLEEWLRFEREHEEFMQEFIRREYAENQSR